MCVTHIGDTIGRKRARWRTYMTPFRNSTPTYGAHTWVYTSSCPRPRASSNDERTRSCCAHTWTTFAGPTKVKDGNLEQHHLQSMIRVRFLCTVKYRLTILLLFYQAFAFDNAWYARIISRDWKITICVFYKFDNSLKSFCFFDTATNVDDLGRVCDRESVKYVHAWNVNTQVWGKSCCNLYRASCRSHRVSSMLHLVNIYLILLLLRKSTREEREC